MDLINVASSSSNWMECPSADHCLIKFLHCHLSYSTYIHHFLITFQVAFALNVRAAFLDVAVVWVLFHGFLGEKKMFYLQIHSVHVGYISVQRYLISGKVGEGRNVRAQLQWLRQPERKRQKQKVSWGNQLCISRDWRRWNEQVVACQLSSSIGLLMKL